MRVTAIGEGASATFEGSTALGADAVASGENEVVLGGAGSSVRIGDLPGTTQECRRFPMRLGDETLYELVDTPAEAPTASPVEAPPPSSGA